MKYARCKGWPYCKSKVSECGGTQKKKYNVYGKDRTNKAQTETWDGYILDRNCAYQLFCRLKAWDCGGITQNACVVFGKGGTREPPSAEASKQAKKDHKNAKQKERDRKRRGQKRTKFARNPDMTSTPVKNESAYTKSTEDQIIAFGIPEQGQLGIKTTHFTKHDRVIIFNARGYSPASRYGTRVQDELMEHMPGASAGKSTNIS